MKKSLLTLVFFILFSQTSFAATQISGQIRNNTTWTKSGSPYVITGLLEIAPGVKLTLEPGTVIEIDQEIHCYGLIEANGTPADSIYFKSNYKSNKPWRFIRVRDTKATDTFIFNYCHFSYGGEIYGFGKETYIITNSFLGTEAKICNFQDSIKLYVANCYVYKTSFYLVGTNARIYNNIFHKGGIASRATPYISIVGNKFDGAGNSLICEGEYNYPMVVHIRNNVFENSAYTALTVNGYGVATFDTLNHLSGNIFVNNPGTAVKIIYMKGKMTGNSIYNNGIGMSVKSWVGNNAFELEGNCIYDNDSLNFVNETEYGYQLGANWWGTVDSNDIATSIFDYGEDFKKGPVIFHPYLIQPDCKLPNSVSNRVKQEDKPYAYPNPFGGTLHIKMAKNILIKEVCLYDVIGKMLIQLTSVMDNKATIDASNLPRGSYFYKIYDTDSRVYSGKVLKQ